MYPHREAILLHKSSGNGNRMLGGGGDREAVNKDPQGLELLPGANQVGNTIKNLINKCL